MQRSAQSLSTIAMETTRDRARLSPQPHNRPLGNVQIQAAAAGELSKSSQEISRQIDHSASIAQSAVAQADRTNTMVDGLLAATQKIGEVMGLIDCCSNQSSGLERDHRSARAGDAGRGFAVVANEVKALIDTDRQGNGGDCRSDRGDPQRHRHNGRSHSRDWRQYDRPDKSNFDKKSL